MSVNAGMRWVCSLRPLLVALNDEDGQVREVAIRLAGRLGGLNPAVVMPALRRHLMQLLADLEHSPDSRQREGAALTHHSTCLWSGPVPCLWSTTSLLSDRVSIVVHKLFCPYPIPN